FRFRGFGFEVAPGGRRGGARRRRARPDAACPAPAAAGSARPLVAGLGGHQAAAGRIGQVVLHGPHARHAPRNLGSPGARADRLDLTREGDYASVDLGVNLRALQLRILLEAVFDALGDLLVVSVHRLAIGGGGHLQLVLHALHTVDALGDLARRTLGLGVVDLATQHHCPALGLHVHLATLDAVIGEERDLRLGGDPGVAHTLLRVLGHALRLVLGLLPRALHLVLRVLGLLLYLLGRRALGIDRPPARSDQGGDGEAGHHDVVLTHHVPPRW